ncbi:hypothetical protein SMA26_25880, partial [Escherichia coli]
IICSPMTSLKTSIKTITYLSDIGCLEIHGASLQYFRIAYKPHFYRCPAKNQLWLHFHQKFDLRAGKHAVGSGAYYREGDR